MPPQVAGATPVSTYLQADEAKQQSATPQSTPQSGNQPNWFEKLLPTIGGIVGGLGAGAADIVTGGAAIPFDAAIAGAGGALGKVAENATTDKSLGGGVLSSGIENGVGQLAGMGLGGVAKGVLGVTSNVADKAGVEALMNQAPGLLDRDTATYLYKNGITNLSKITDIAPKVVGQAGGEGAAFTNGIRGAVDNSADRISVGNTMESLRNSLDEAPLGNNEKTVGAAIQKSFERMAKASGGDVTKVPKFGASGKPLQDTISIFSDSGQTNNMSRGAVYNEATKFQKAASQIAAKAPKDQFGNLADPNQAALVHAYRTYGNGLEENALGLGPLDNPLDVSDDAKDEMKQGISSLEKSHPELHKTLSDNIDSASTWKDIRSSTSPLVNANKAFDAISGKLNSVPSTTPLQAASSGKAGILKSIVSSPTASKVESGTMKQLSKVTGKAAASKVLPILARGGAIAAANLPNDAGSPTGSINGTIAGGANMQPNLQSSLQSSPLMTAYNAALAGGPATPGYSQIISSLGPEAQKLQTAAPIIQQLLQGYGTAGGPQGTSGGLLSKLSGLVPGTAANVYNQQSGSAAATLAQILGISPEAAAGLIPQLTAAPTTAAPQVQNLQSIFGGIGG